MKQTETLENIAAGRETINNIWDKDPVIEQIRNEVVSNRGALLELSYTGISLLSADDPYQVKLGIQMLRLCLSLNTGVAEFWMNAEVDKLMKHEHPRVRHSALWNARTAVWYAPNFSEKGLQLAKQGLKDADPAVQRVAIWTHGDSVINNPTLFADALESINGFVDLNKKESVALFALEEFFIPLRRMFGTHPDYISSLENIISGFNGYPGTKMRAASLIDGYTLITADDQNHARERILRMSESSTVHENIVNAQYNDAINILLSELKSSKSFGTSMKTVWMMREVLWLAHNNADLVFNELKEIVLHNTDGDLIRTICVILGDCLLVSPSLAKKALDFVGDFFEITDNDGSQIVVAQTLFTLVGRSQEFALLFSEQLPHLMDNAANKSVVFTLSLINEDLHE